MSDTHRDPRVRALMERNPGDPTPLASIVNFGPVTLPELAAVGITTVDQIERLGAEEVCRRWIERFPERLNVNAIVGVVATLEGVPWTKISHAGRAQAKAIAGELRALYGPR